ncbi:hypothetical protein [Seleniivibrio woodruffii]|uniref:hypothetical protein n=1 Tax=Seleniivibrio woodruffii TaxID=1078050 RepID=UPI0026F00420|nr:hypothetical protein [Seleniivibrio woodruffii]
MGRTYDIADNLVKMAERLKYGDHSAKDKVLEYAGKLISEEFGSTSIYMQKLGMIVFTARDMSGLSFEDAKEVSRDKYVFQEGVKRLVALLEQVRGAIGEPAKLEGDFVVVQARDKNSLARITSYIKAKGYNTIVISDTDDWKEKLDELLP